MSRIRNIIFDMDQTLVDTLVLEPYRNSRDWKRVYRNIYKCQLYNGMLSVFDYIRVNAITTCIVSSAPRSYVECLVEHFNIPCDYIVAYHDTRNKKPSSEPFYKALEFLRCDKKDVISFGDRVVDIQASKSASIRAVACTWGTQELSDLICSQADMIINEAMEIIDLIS